MSNKKLNQKKLATLLTGLLLTFLYFLITWMAIISPLATSVATDNKEKVFMAANYIFIIILLEFLNCLIFFLIVVAIIGSAVFVIFVISWLHDEPSNPYENDSWDKLMKYLGLE
jgi:hypothetical protein